MSALPAVARLDAEDLSLLVEAVRDFARHELVAAAPGVDQGNPARAARCWQQVGELGLDRGLLPERAGGGGVPPGAWLAVVEELAAAEPGVALAVALHNLALLALPEDRLDAVAGRWALAAVPDDAPAGVVRSVLGAAGAEGVVLLRPGGAVAAVLGPDDGGWSVTRDPHQLGLRGARAGDVHLDAAPAGAAGDGAAPYALLYAAVASIARGISRRSYELALEYAGARRQGGHRIGRYGAVRQMLAGMSLAVEGSTHPWDDATPADWAGPRLLRTAIAAKVTASDAAGQTAIDAVQVFGGSGYVRESGVEKLMRDAKYCQLYPEPNWRARARLIALEPGVPPALS